MPEFQNVLAIDTALSGCCAGVFVAGKNQGFNQIESMPRGQAERLIPMIGVVLEKADLTYDDLDALVVTVGPGAFTGLRIGLSAARSLSMALDIPLFGITSFQAMMLKYLSESSSNADVGVVLETKRKDFYFQHFSANGEALSEGRALPGDEVSEHLTEPYILIGDACARFQAETGLQGDVEEYALTLPSLIAQALCAGKDLFCPPEPLYLRGADVSQPKKPARILESGAFSSN